MAAKKTPEPQKFAQETITYSIAATADTAAAHVSLVLTYDTTQSKYETQHDYYHVAGVSGTYTQTANGKTATYPITGLIPKMNFRSNDNRIYLNATGGHSTIVDKHGLSFTVSMPTDHYRTRMERVHLSYPGTTGHYRQATLLAGQTKIHASVARGLTASASTKTTRATSSADQPVCFAAGTRILTTRGEVAVEALAVGDLVVTASGAARPIRWLGHRTIEVARHPRPHDVMPVRIAAHAFGPAKPARDLVVSPGHALCVDVLGEVLIPASALVDDVSIVRDPVARVTYWHVELDSHDLLVAENLAAESYLEMRNRGFFVENGLVDLAAAPDAPIVTHADFCRPYVDRGPLLAVAREGFAKRAAAPAKSADVRAA